MEPPSPETIVDELTRGDPDPVRLREFLAHPRRFDGGRFEVVPDLVLEEAARQIEAFLSSGELGELGEIDPTRPAAVIPEIDVPFEPPAEIGRYLVVRELGRGGFGVVYQCRDLDKNREVAIKVLKRKLAKALEERFYDEAWIAKSMPPHPNLVALLDHGIDERQGPFLVHEYVEGHDLSDQRLPMALPAARRCLREIAGAMAHLHAHRVIHRDLKPSNVRLLSSDPAAAPEGVPVLKVLDLGIAALLSPEAPGGRRTQAGDLLGTLRYMAPEQLQRLPVDERTDVYAFALIAYEILTGHPPFGSTMGDVMDRLRRQYQGPSVDRLSGLPAWLRQLVVAGLSFERMGRPDGFVEVLRSLNLEQPPRIAPRAREEEWRALLAAFPPPQVGSINPYKILHLQRGEVGEAWDFEARLPPYVRRDVDAELDALLARDEAAFLLLAGPSKCGKSRTAFEALARNAADRALLLPERLEDTRSVLDALPRLEESWPRPILWLDNVHEHLRAQSLPAGQLQQALDRGVTVVATIWDSELLALAGRGAAAPAPGGGTGVDTAVLRAARDVLQHARIVRIEATTSAVERERAQALYPNLAFDAGLGETFVARVHLLQRFENGSRELKALVWALVDCARAGLLDGTPLAVLRQIMPAYLQLVDPGAWIGGARAERLLERALEQGTEPVGVHQRLILHVGHDTFKVYDPLRYHVEQTRDRWSALPSLLWRAVLGASNFASAAESLDRDETRVAGRVDETPVATAAPPGARHAPGVSRWRHLLIGWRNRRRGAYATSTEADTQDLPAARYGAAVGSRRAEAHDTWTAGPDFSPPGRQARWGVNWVVAGLTAWQTGERRAAEEAYRTGMRQGSAAAACSLGLLLESTGDREGARSAFEKAIELGDPNAAFHLALLRGEAPATEPTDRPDVDGSVRVTVRERQGVIILDLAGALTLGGGYQMLHRRIHPEIDRGGERFLLHLAAVTAIDPAGVGALVGALTAAVHRGRALRLCRVPSEIIEILTSHGLLRIFDVYESEDEAVASFARSSG